MNRPARKLDELGRGPRADNISRELPASPRWQRLALAGAHPQRMPWASTDTQVAAAPDTHSVQAPTASDTINTLPEKAPQAFAGHVTDSPTMPVDGG